jgi:hypothetical protein
MLLLPACAAASQRGAAAPECRATGPLVRLPGLPEASGLAASRRLPGTLWTHNDSGGPVVYALDTAGAITGQWRLTGARVEDWEAIAVGPCPGGSCIYVGDIGDNKAERKRITIYRVAEPASASGGQAPVNGVFHATYPDGAHDAETLLIAPDGSLFVVTKGDAGPVAVYRFPKELKPGATHQLERVGAPRNRNGAGRDDRITDGAVSPDGQWTVLRSTAALVFYRTAGLLTGVWSEARRVDVTGNGETVARESSPGSACRCTCTASAMVSWLYSRAGSVRSVRSTSVCSSRSHCRSPRRFRTPTSTSWRWSTASPACSCAATSTPAWKRRSSVRVATTRHFRSS